MGQPCWHSRWLSFYSSRCGECPVQGQSLLSSSHCPLSPGHSWRPGLGVCTEDGGRESGKRGGEGAGRLCGGGCHPCKLADLCHRTSATLLCPRTSAFPPLMFSASIRLLITASAPPFPSQMLAPYASAGSAGVRAPRSCLPALQVHMWLGSNQASPYTPNTALNTHRQFHFILITILQQVLLYFIFF